MNRCEIGDCRDTLREWIAQGVKVQMCVTSPPYWGLRDYGTAQWEGGEDECDHKQTVARHDGGRVNVNGFNGSARPDSDKGAINYRDACGKCGAKRIDRQLGLEPTPAEYVANMVEVFRLVREVLTDDGVVFLNLGDSYFGSSTTGGTNSIQGSPKRVGAMSYTSASLKPKDLVGIPWRVAFALQADGWWLRQDIIWSKPNPMPESVTDRCTKAHEYLFLLAKSERYYYDAAAIAEPANGVWNSARSAFASETGTDAILIGDPLHRTRKSPNTNHPDVDRQDRNRRSVWTIATEPYAEAHFATFPTALIEPCIMAGSRPGDVVLDPFFGSGTTGEVCERLGRRWLGCELNPQYVELQRKRTAQRGMVLA